MPANKLLKTLAIPLYKNFVDTALGALSIASHKCYTMGAKDKAWC